MANEHYIASNRDSARKSVLDALGKPWSTFCEAPGKKRLVESIDSYLWQRTGHMASYPKNWGEPGRRYIVRAWSTPDDNRIEPVTRETYARGFFSLDDFKPYTRAALAEVVKSERVTGKPCAG